MFSDDTVQKLIKKYDELFLSGRNIHSFVNIPEEELRSVTIMNQRMKNQIVFFEAYFEEDSANKLKVGDVLILEDTLRTTDNIDSEIMIAKVLEIEEYTNVKYTRQIGSVWCAVICSFDKPLYMNFYLEKKEK